MKIKNFSLRKLLYNKKFNVAASIVLAFIVWLVIVINQTPTIDRTISVPVIVDTEGTAAGDMGLDEISGVSHRTVAVKVSGPAYIVSALTTDDISVKASLSDVTAPGKYDLILSAVKNRLGGDYSVVSISPTSISAAFDYIDTKQFTVTPNVTGVSAVSGLIAEAPVFSNNQTDVITIKGPRTEMQKIVSVEACVQTNEVLSVTKTFDADIVLLDSSGEVLDNSVYTLSTTKAEVSVPISKMKTVPVVATFSNAPDDFKTKNISYKLSNNEVTIIGPQATVDSISSIELSPIDFFAVSSSKKKFDMAPVLPDGVRIVDNIEKVTVTLTLNSYAERTFTVSSISADNTAYSVKLTSSIKNVKICGPSSVINKLSAKDLYAYVDLNGKTKGDYTVAVTILSKNHSNIWQVGTYQATIRIE